MTATFETIYKTQVQKHCPFLKNQSLTLNSFESASAKGDCMESVYRLSLIFEQLDKDLTVGNFNNSLTDSGKIVLALPATLDKCNQPAFASIVRNNLPEECVGSIGATLRELGVFEHNFDHFEWLSKHWRDLFKYLGELRATCPALEKKEWANDISLPSFIT